MTLNRMYYGTLLGKGDSSITIDVLAIYEIGVEEELEFKGICQINTNMIESIFLTV